jgi:hypothetical protein
MDGDGNGWLSRGTNDVSALVGRTLHIFNWTGVTPTGAFAVSSPYAWDLSNVYTTGEVTFIAIPEPATLVLAALSFAPLACQRRDHSRRNTWTSASQQ